jgi:hypothetical protein
MRRAAVSLAILSLASAMAACSADVTQSNVVLTLQNDLGFGVTLTVCDDAACHSLPSSVNDHLGPDQTMTANVSTEGVATYYRVTADSGGPARCLALVVNGHPQQKTVVLSSAHACGSS